MKHNDQLNNSSPLEAPPSAEELERFEALQQKFSSSFKNLIQDPNAPKTVIILPSLSLDQQMMSRISGVHHYEERMLCLLLLLRMPRTRVIYLTSMPIRDSIIDYYLHLLPGVPGQHARKRLTLLSCDDTSPVSLTQKILERPRLIKRIKEAIPDYEVAHISCFTVTELERRLALQLNLPIYGCDPALSYWGTKSGSRKIFREANIDMPAGFEDLTGENDIKNALCELKQQNPHLTKAVVKINEGFSGEGNAIVDLRRAPATDEKSLQSWLDDNLHKMAFEAEGMTSDQYLQKFKAMGGIVEEFIPGKSKQSPSVQFRIDPTGHLSVISTHDQVLEGENNQIFVGCRFPADDEYRLELQQSASKAAEALVKKGILGRFGIDFISLKEDDKWRHFAIEINLRKGGTTHPFLMLQFLTDGNYNEESGEYLTQAGEPRCYFASDNLESERIRGLTPEDLVDIAVMNRLHFHAASGEGVVFHLMGALSEFGKLGVVCIGKTQARAGELYKRTVDVLRAEGRKI